MATKAGPNIITDGLVLNIDFSNKKSYIGSGTSCVDLKGDTVGTLTNGPVFSNIQNGVMSFDGSNGYIEFDTSALVTNNATISFWINTNQTESQFVNYVFSMGNGSSQNFSVNIGGTYSDYRTPVKAIGLFINNSLYSSTVANTFTTTDYYKWNHICITYDYSTGVKIYKNGILLSMFSNEVVSTTISSHNKINLGRRADGQWYYSGKLSDVKLYNRSLSYDEVQKIYTATRKRFVETPKTIPGLQLWLDGADLGTMRQNSNGTTAVAVNGDPVGYWGDKSGNGRHAIQATSNSRPLIYSNQNNGLPALQFDGSDDWLYTNTSGTVGTIINVYYHTNSGWSLYDGVFSIRTNTYLLNASSFCYSLGAPSNNYSTKISVHASPGNGNGIACDDLPSPADSRINGQTVQSAFNYYTQGQTVSQLWNIIDSRFVPVSGTYNIGFGVDVCCAGRYSPMKYAECLIYDRYLSDSELKTIYGYLNQKWNIF